MPQSDVFKVFQGNYIPADGWPVVIIAVRSLAGTLYSEFFIFVQDNDRNFYSQRASCKKTEISAVGLKLDLAFMMNDTLERAKGRLNYHLYEKYQKSKNTVYLHHAYELSETNQWALVRLHMMNRYSDQLQMVLKTTKCRKLRDFLDQLVFVPKMSFEGET